MLDKSKYQFKRERGGGVIHATIAEKKDSALHSFTTETEQIFWEANSWTGQSEIHSSQ